MVFWWAVSQRGHISDVPPEPSTSSPFSPLPGAVQWVRLEKVVLSYSAHRPANIADSFQMFNMFLNSTFKLWGNISWEHYLRHTINHLKKWQSSDLKEFYVVQHFTCNEYQMYYLNCRLILFYSYRIEKSWTWLNCENIFLPWLAPPPVCSQTKTWLFIIHIIKS